MTLNFIKDTEREDCHINPNRKCKKRTYHRDDNY